MKVPFSAISDDDSFDVPTFQPIKRKSLGEEKQAAADARSQKHNRLRAGKGSNVRNAEMRKRMSEF